jgi:hypothetical protein
MIKNILDFISLVTFFAFLYFLLIIGDVWENKVRCDRGYTPACQAYNISE